MHAYILKSMQRQPKPARPLSDEWLGLARALLVLFVLLFLFLIYTEARLRRAEQSAAQYSQIKGE